MTNVFYLLISTFNFQFSNLFYSGIISDGLGNGRKPSPYML